MSETAPKRKSYRFLYILLILILLLLPGIRGYENWRWDEYLMILLIITGIIYRWKKDSDNPGL